LTSAGVGSAGAEDGAARAGVLLAEAEAADSARDAREAEYQAFVRELEGRPPPDDPFAGGVVPDLIIASSIEGLGEIDPCG
jgi:hypothetical protein